MNIACVVGTDLGSTTTKSIILDGDGEILGRGITNSRSDYDRAAQVSRSEAFITARFNLLKREVEEESDAIPTAGCKTETVFNLVPKDDVCDRWRVGRRCSVGKVGEVCSGNGSANSNPIGDYG